MQKWQGFYAIVDPEYCVLSALETADAILRAGPTALQLRWKNASDRERFELGRGPKTLQQRVGAPLS